MAAALSTLLSSTVKSLQATYSTETLEPSIDLLK